MKQPFNPDDRTYLVSDERLKAFKSLTPAERLKMGGRISNLFEVGKT